MPMTEMVNAVAPPQLKSFTSWKIVIVATVVAGVTIFFLVGPVLDQVFRGQVYFAVIVGFMFGAYAVRWVLKVDDVRALWPGPLLLGIFGLVIAGLRPNLMIPPDYHHTNLIPAWPLVRMLPGSRR